MWHIGSIVLLDGELSCEAIIGSDDGSRLELFYISLLIIDLRTTRDECYDV